jgi:hypothetical protein
MKYTGTINILPKATFPRGVDTKACYAFVLAFVNLQA